MAIKPIQGFYVHDEASSTDGVGQYDYKALANVPFDSQNVIESINDYRYSEYGYSALVIDYQRGRYIENGYTDMASCVNNVGYLEPGRYVVETSMGSNFQFGIWKYVSDSSGTVVVTFGNSKQEFTLTDRAKLTVRKLDGVAFTLEEVKALRSTLVVTRKLNTVENELHIAKNENEKLNIANITWQTGAGYCSPQVSVNGETSVYIANSSGTTVDLRLLAESAFSVVGIAETVVYVYIPDVTKIATFTVQYLGTSFSRGQSAADVGLVNGWNEVHIITAVASLTNWATSTGIRIVATGTAGLSIYVGRVEMMRPEKANLIFVEDGGYSTFLEDGYPALRELGVPVTWALNPGRLGVDAGVAGHVLTQAEIDSISADYCSEFSFHSWEAGVTATMTAEELRADACKCINYLRKQGLAPEHMWRAAHTQNNAPQAAAEIGLVEALATSTQITSSTTLYPFPDPNNVPRMSIHSRDETYISGVFDLLKKTHGTVVMYTHGISSGSSDISPESFEYLLEQISTGISEGWLNPTTYNRLRNVEENKKNSL